MRCSQAQARLSAYLDDELAPTWRRAVHGHLHECAACRAVACDLEALRGELRALPEPELEVPGDLFARIEATMAAQDAAHSQASAVAQTLRAWWAAWRGQRGLHVGLGLAAVAGLAVVVATWSQAKRVAAPQVVARQVDVDVEAPLPVDTSDDEAAAAYLEVVAELRLTLRQTLRIDDPAEMALWKSVQARLQTFDRALAQATDGRTRRQLGAEAAAYLGDVLAQQRTDALIARASW